MDKNTPIKVLNRDNGAVVYSIPEMNGLTRVFQAGETKEVTYEELQKLSYIPGGSELLRDSLVILDNSTTVEDLIGHVEPEYYYTKDDIINLMKIGSLDAFLDCLDFAPEGVKDLIKTLAVDLPLNDVSKREAILDKLGFNVDNAIRIKNESTEPQEEEHIAKRRIQKEETKPAETVTRRRTIVKKEN